jgi:inner membrane protein
MAGEFKTWAKESITFKFVVIAILTLLLLIPASMIESIIYEREITRDKVIREVSSKWANEQLLTGPVLSIPYLVTQTIKEKDDEKNIYKERKEVVKKYAHFLPSELLIEGSASPEVRYRSIYEVVVYSSELKLSSKFQKPDFSIWKLTESQILYDETTLCFGITDMRGINKLINFRFNDSAYEAGPGIPSRDVLSSGVSAIIGKIESGENTFEFTLDVNGSQSLNFIPVGKETTVKLSSNWKDPSFTGAFLPDERTVSKDGFEASWNILALNRTYPQQWLENQYPVINSKFGVDLIFAVDLYQKSERSVKYAIIFLSLTFLIFILSEITQKKRVHPIQYFHVPENLRRVCRNQSDNSSAGEQKCPVEPDLFGKRN